MSDHRRLRARSPVSNPARMSAPIISAGAPTVNYGRSADLHGSLHAIPTRREHFVSPRSSGGSIETATHYKIKPERDSLAPPKTHGRSRRNTVDASSQPIIVTPTSRYNVVVGEPSSARASRDSDIHDYRGEEAYIQPSSSGHRHRDKAYSGYRGSSRNQHTIDNADISERHPHDREAPQDRLLRVGSARDGQMYPLARPITKDTLVRHPDTVKDDYGDNGYGYTNPKDLVEYDLETATPRSSGGIPQRRHSRRESWDNSRGGRPASIGGFSELQRPYESRAERERGPPPSTRGFDRIVGDRNSGIYHMPPSVHMPMPHDHIGSPLTQAPSSAYPAENLGVPQRRTSTRRPVSVYNDDRDRDRRERDRMSRDEYDIVDGRSRGGNTFAHEDVSSRGFGIRPDLMPAANVINVQPPAAIDSRPLERPDRVDRVEREDERPNPRVREEKRYHESDERRYNVSERDSRRDDRDRERSERRPEPRPEHDDRDRKIGAGVAAGSIAAAAMGVGASAAARDSARESRNSDEDREREHARRSRRESDQYYNERPRRDMIRDDEPPVVDLSGRDPIERTSPREDRGPREPREREREYRDERAHDSDSRRDRDRDSDNSRRDPAREPRRESPLQSEKVDLSDRYPVIERNVAKEDVHYPSDNSRSSPPLFRRDRDRDFDSDNRGSRRDRVYDEAAAGRETISSPVAMNDKEARDLRALREDMGLDRATDDSPPPPRPPKEPIDVSRTLAPTVGFSRQSTDQISDRPLDSPSRQVTIENERSFVPPALTGEYSSQAPTTGTTSSRDSLPARPRFSERDRGYSSTSTSSTSSEESAVGTPREHSRERKTSNRQSVQVVSPPRSPSSSQATLPVKGILKAPRVFPELPAEERPGVAPLIDKKTGKNWDGREMADVPPSARWTKISRKLVNPEALEKGKERYEVRDDFVVVLRVLTKDEIQGYAIMTQGIRAQREDEEREERRRAKGGDTEVEDTEREDRRRRRRDDDETEEERAERKRKERERDERRRKYDDEETSEDREQRKAKEREERHRRRREERYRSEPREDETADQAEERRRRERAERHERHERRRRERGSRSGRDDDEDRERRRRRHRERRERDEESDTTGDERDDREERRRRRREREID